MKHLTKFILAVFCIGTIALIGAATFDPIVADASISDRIQGSSTDGLSDNIDQAGSSLVDTARDIGIVVIFIFIIWIGYALFFSNSSQGMADMKGRIGILILAIIFVFFTEEIVSTIFGFFGKSIS